MSAYLPPPLRALAGRVVAQLGAGKVAQAAPQAPAIQVEQVLSFPHLLEAGRRERCGSSRLGWHHSSKKAAGHISSTPPLTRQLAVGSVRPLSYFLQHGQALPVPVSILLGGQGRFWTRSRD